MKAPFASGAGACQGAGMRIIPLALLLPTLAACAQTMPPPQNEPPRLLTQQAFWTNLSSHCGQAYEGAMVSTDAADRDMVGAAMVMHVRECSDRRIAIPFHIRQADGSWDRSRTWVVTRIGADGQEGLRLKHDHRHADGSEDAVTQYGGDTPDTGSTNTQSFAVDADSIALFRANGLDASVTNVWRFVVDGADAPGATITYQLERTIAGGAPAPRDFRVVFDATKPVPAPPAPWGW